MAIAVQTSVGPIGVKATTELSDAFLGLANCGRFQYGLDESGIFLLNSGNVDNLVQFEKSFTLKASDFGKNNFKSFRFIYLQAEVYGNTTFTVSVQPNKGTWITKTVSVVGAGLKTIKFSIKSDGGKGNYHTVKVTSNEQFRIHNISALLIVRSLISK